jgi:predicted metal-dependent enzyme (double-stranded beta helix superfamily)
MRGMDRATASQQIRDHCNAASAAITKIHPLLNALGDEATKGEIVKALYELTKNVEVVKKQIMRLEKRDDTTLL